MNPTITRTDRKETALSCSKARLALRWDDRGGGARLSAWSRPAGMELDEYFDEDAAAFIVEALSEFLAARKRT